jgi:hypothetical protein
MIMVKGYSDSIGTYGTNTRIWFVISNPSAVNSTKFSSVGV